MARKRRRHRKLAFIRPFTRLDRRERAWAHAHVHDDNIVGRNLAKRAERAMQTWKQNLSRRECYSIGETRPKA
jgi:hypothetical protein